MTAKSQMLWTFAITSIALFIGHARQPRGLPLEAQRPKRLTPDGVAYRAIRLVSEQDVAWLGGLLQARG
jgi:hypothetical protein